MNRSFACLAMVVATLSLSQHRLHGQADPDSVKRRNDCRLASQVIETGQPAPHKDWALRYIAYCDPAEKVSAYLAGVERARRSTDLLLIRGTVGAVQGFRDGRLFDRVLEVAGDASASVPARVVAFIALKHVLDPFASPTYERFVGGLDERGVPRGGCSLRRAHAVGYTEGPVPIAADYRERIRALTRRVLADASQPGDVRSAAACT